MAIWREKLLLGGLLCLVVTFSPLLVLWTFLGWIFTSSPRICAVVSLLVVTYLIGFSSLYSWNILLFDQYFIFLFLFLYCFVYLSTTNLFRFIFFTLILFLQLFLFFKITQPTTLSSFLISFFTFSLSPTPTSPTTSTSTISPLLPCPYRIFLASSITLFATCNIIIVLLNLWLPASEMKFLNAEDRFLQSRCNRKLNRMLVSSLGTIEVTDKPLSQIDSIIVENKISKPILVLLHGYGGCNAQWVDCLSKLQTRFQVYCVELYGFGRSSRVGFEWGQRWEGHTLEDSLNLMTTALESWRETLQIQQFILVTHSLSCYVGMAYLLKYPGHITHLYPTSPIGLHHTAYSSFSPFNTIDRRRTSSFYSPSSTGTEVLTPSSSFFPSWELKSLSLLLWESRFTPMDLLRWFGPIGPCCFSKFLSWYRQQILPSSNLNQYSPLQFHLFAQCYYQTLASPAFGERSLSDFMSVDGHMHLSLVSLIEKYTLSGSSLSLSTSPMSTTTTATTATTATSAAAASAATRPSLSSYGTFNESISKKLINLNMVIFIWGDNDHIRSSQQNQSSLSQQGKKHKLNSKEVKKSKISSDPEWIGDHLQESEFMTFLQVNGINCEGYEVQQAGHLLHLDNPDELCDIIIQSYENSVE